MLHGDFLYLQDIQPTRVSFFLSHALRVKVSYTMYMDYGTAQKHPPPPAAKRGGRKSK